MKDDFTELLTHQTIPVSKLVRNIHEVNKLIILVDIVGFSKFTSRQQLNAIYLLQHYILKNLKKNSMNFSKIEDKEPELGTETFKWEAILSSIRK